MSAPPSSWISNSTYNKFKGSYFNGDVDSSQNIICRNGNLYLSPNSYIYTQNNTIQFDETYQFTNFSNNVHVYGYLQIDNSATFGNGITITSGNFTMPTNSTITSGSNSITFDNTYAFTNFNNSVHVLGTLQVDFGGTTYDAGDLISNIGNMDFNPTYTQHTFTNTLTTGMLQIRDALSNDINLTPKLRDLYSGVYVANNISNTFNLQQNFSNSIRLDGSLIVSNNTLSLSNSNLSKIQYLANVVSDVNTSLANRVDLTSVQTISGSKNWGSTQNFTNIKLDGTLAVQTGTVTLTNLEISRLSGVTSNIQSSFNTLNTKTTAQSYNSITNTTTFSSTYLVGQFIQSTSHLRIDGGLYVNAGATFILNSTLSNINYLSGLTANVNTSITNLNTKTTNQSYTSATNTTSWTGNLSFPAGSISTSAISGGVVSLGSNNTYTGLNTYNSGVQMSNQFACVDNTNGVQIACYGGRTWDNGTAGDIVNEWVFNNGSQKGFTIQGGGSSTYGEFGMYYIQTTPSFATRQPIMYGKHTGNISGDTLNIASNTLSCKSITFDGTLNSISPTTLSYVDFSSSGQSQINSANSNISTLQGQMTTANSNISSLQQTLTRASYVAVDDTTYFFGTLFGQSLTFQNTINGISTTIFTYLSGLTRNIETTFISILSSISSLNSSVSSINNSLPPVGSVIYTFGNTESSNFLFCNGQALSRTTYSVLFGIIGTTYGAPDANTFNLPNVNGLFIRSVGSQTISSITYTAQALGVKQQDQVQSHTHSGQAGTYLGNTNQTSTTNSYVSIGGSVKPNTFSFATTGGMNSGLSGTETRPVSIAMTALIRVL